MICYTDYSAAIDYANEQHKQGIYQLRCGTCARWVWPDQCQHQDRLTRQQFAALVKAVERRYPVGQGEKSYMKAVRKAFPTSQPPQGVGEGESDGQA